MTPEHRERTRLLDSLALLAGFEARVAVLPDGRVPDVVRVAFRPPGLFIGDAKHADSPNSVESYLRLRRYLCWGETFLRRPGRTLVVAIATPDVAAREWQTMLLALTDDVGLSVDRSGSTAFGTTTVVEVESRSRPPHARRLAMPSAEAQSGA